MSKIPLEGLITDSSSPAMLGETLTPLSSTELQRARRRGKAHILREKNANIRNLAERARRRTPATEAQKAREHNEEAWKTTIRKTEMRAGMISGVLAGAPKQSTAVQQIGGERLNASVAGLLNRNDRGALADVETSPDAIHATSRAQGATLPPPHPRSLSEKAKHSPKAKRDAWRSGKIAGGAASIVNLNPRAKGWDKIKAIEPGTLPDLD